MRLNTSRICLLALVAVSSALASAQTNTQTGAFYEKASQQALVVNPNLAYSPYTVIVRFRSGATPIVRDLALSQANALPIRPLIK